MDDQHKILSHFLTGTPQPRAGTTFWTLFPLHRPEMQAFSATTPILWTFGYRVIFDHEGGRKETNTVNRPSNDVPRVSPKVQVALGKCGWPKFASSSLPPYCNKNKDILVPKTLQSLFECFDNFPICFLSICVFVCWNSKPSFCFEKWSLNSSRYMRVYSRKKYRNVLISIFRMVESSIHNRHIFPLNICSSRSLQPAHNNRSFLQSPRANTSGVMFMQIGALFLFLTWHLSLYRSSTILITSLAFLYRTIDFLTLRLTGHLCSRRPHFVHTVFVATHLKFSRRRTLGHRKAIKNRPTNWRGQRSQWTPERLARTQNRVTALFSLSTHVLCVEPLAGWLQVFCG